MNENRGLGGRREAAYRRFGTRTPRCGDCGETDWRCLTGTTPDIRCYEHRRLAQGKSSVEDHHFAGKLNSRVSGVVPGNDHRVLSDMQQDWRAPTLRNADGSPLLKIAAVVQSWLDLMRLLIERAIGWIPEALERLDALLRVHIGERWWDELGWGFNA